MYGNDRAILIAAIEQAAATYNATHPVRTLIWVDPDREILDILTSAIEKCETYKAVEGHFLFSGGTEFSLQASTLASKLFVQGIGLNENAAGAADWLIRLLTTRETTCFFKVAMWGLSHDRETPLSDSARLLPFSSLPDSYMKYRLSERAKPCYDGSHWLAQTYFDKPTAAIVETIENFPYIREGSTAFQVMQDRIWKAYQFSTIAQAASLGHPLAVACWFDYADRSLEYSEIDNSLTWLLPEIHPRVRSCAPIDVTEITSHLAQYDALPAAQSSRLFRSMERFGLSLCRTQTIDRVLDLALAFEIAVSEKGDNAPPSWKVSVRSAQLIGGPLLERQNTRSIVSTLYELRSQATHGGTLHSKSRKKPEDELLQESCDVYVKLMKRLLCLPDKPDWKSLELGPET